MNRFINDAFYTKPGKPIIAIFRNGREVRYTTNVIELLKSDRGIIEIVDAETGEILFDRT